MANEVLQKTGTAITWRGSGGDYGLSLESLATGNAAQGAKGDLGATRAAQFTAELFLETGAAAPASGVTYDIYWAPSNNATAGSENPGGTSGTDAAYTGTAGDSVADSVAQLQFLGSLVCTSDAQVIQQQSFTLSPPTRYGMPVIVNNSAQTSETNDDEHKFVLTPIIDEIQ